MSNNLLEYAVAHLLIIVAISLGLRVATRVQTRQHPTLKPRVKNICRDVPDPRIKADTSCVASFIENSETRSYF